MERTEGREESLDGNMCILLTDDPCHHSHAVSRCAAASHLSLFSHPRLMLVNPSSCLSSCLADLARDSCSEHQITSSHTCMTPGDPSLRPTSSPLPPFHHLRLLMSHVLMQVHSVCRLNSRPSIGHHSPPFFLIPNDPNNLSRVIRHDLHQDFVPCHLVTLFSRPTTGDGTRNRNWVFHSADCSGCVCLLQSKGRHAVDEDVALETLAGKCDRSQDAGEKIAFN